MNTINPAKIRPAQDSDLGALAALVRDLLVYEKELAGTRGELNPWAASQDEVLKQMHLPDTKFFIAERDGALVGYLRAVIAGREVQRYDLTVMARLRHSGERVARWFYFNVLRRPRPAVRVESGYIAGVYVMPEARNAGIGRELAAAAEEWFVGHGLGASELHVLFNNIGARRLWEDLGYEPVALGMRKRIKKA